MSSYLLFPSHFGSLGIVWREIDGSPRILRVFLPRPDLPALDLVRRSFPEAGLRASVSSSPSVAAVVDRMKRFLLGHPVQFGLDMLALEQCSAFQIRVLRAEHRIPRGQVSTYGGIARHVGSPQGARAVGAALARNPFPILIPCHRAIRSDGKPGGFQGGPEMKRVLLELEGVEFSPTGRVLAERYYP